MKYGDCKWKKEGRVVWEERGRENGAVADGVGYHAFSGVRGFETCKKRKKKEGGAHKKMSSENLRGWAPPILLGGGGEEQKYLY